MLISKNNELFLIQSLASDLYTASIGLAEDNKEQSDTFIKHATKLLPQTKLQLKKINADIIKLVTNYRYPENKTERQQLADMFSALSYTIIHAFS